MEGFWEKIYKSKTVSNLMWGKTDTERDYDSRIVEVN